ncbi:hypothetical protein ACET3Z_010454 [Daucus carota]
MSLERDSARLIRLRHPGVLHVVEALDDSKNALVMATELLFASVANVLGNVDNIAKVPKELKGMRYKAVESLREVEQCVLEVLPKERWEEELCVALRASSTATSSKKINHGAVLKVLYYLITS